MRVLVTGGSGFLGGTIVRQLEASGRIADGDDLEIYDLNEPDYNWDNITFNYGEIAVMDKYRLSPYDMVFHCAGLLGSETLFDRIKQTESTNVEGTLNVLELQKDYGLVIQPGLLGNWLNPYMISKRTAERYGLMYRKWYNTKYVSIRPTDIYGPRQSIAQKKITPTFIQQALSNEPITIYGDGSYKVRMLYVDDVARFFIEIAFGDITEFSTIDLGSLLPTNYISVKDYALLIRELSDSQSEIIHIPMRLGQPTEAKDAEVDLGQTGTLSDLIGWSETPLEVGLHKTIEYYKGL